MKNTALLAVLLVALLILGACDLLGPKDEEDPVIQITSPTSYFSFATIEPTVDISGTAIDNEEIKSIKVSVNGGSGIDASGTSIWTAEDIPLDMGDNVIVCKVEDKAGNSAEATLWVVRNTDVYFPDHPYFSQSSFFANQSGYPVVRQALTAAAKQISSVKVARLDEDLNVLEEIGDLYDDGNLSHHDEILGDGIYTGSPEIYETETGIHYYRIVAYSDSKVANYSPLFKINVYEEITQAEVTTIIEDYTGISDALNQSGAESLEEGPQVLKDWFLAKPEVTNAEIVDGYLEVTYDTGIKGGVIFSETDEDGYVITLGGSSSPRRNTSPTIPIPRQTRGVNSGSNFVYRGYDPKEEDEDVIQDKDVFLWQPYTTTLPASCNVQPGLSTIFGDSDLGLNVVSLSGSECTIASLNNLSEYGTIIFYTHGVGGEHLLTSEAMNDDNIWDYLAQILNDEIGFFENVTYSAATGFSATGTVYSVRSAYISNLPGTLPNSVVFNSSCESFKTNNLRDAFSAKGANAYLGFSKIVGAIFAKDRVMEYFQRLAVDIMNNGDAFISGQSDPGHHHAEYKMWGREDLHYSFDLINGDFEMGNLNGWFREGDGRVITQLANLEPTQGSYMGIISTGLGYTTSNGSISQSFRVPQAAENLSIKWNFISEEFMEYVGSQYQDYLTISIVDSLGNTNTLLHETIDSFVGYGLTDCSPPVAFDQGDCFMTDWRQLISNMQAYQGQVVRLKISVGDVGDSIYDSACLLDEITLY